MADLPSTLDIIVVNWNTGPLLKQCLESIRGASLQGLRLNRVVIVDNASADGSADGIADDAPYEVIRNTTNRGFAAACNQGAHAGDADFLLFLNPDTRLFANSLSVPVLFMETSSSGAIGICGIQLVDDGGEVRRTCARFPTPVLMLARMLGLDAIVPGLVPSHFMTEWDHKTGREVDQVMGAFFLVRGSLFRDLSGFDERFFVFYEDVDFSLRARHQGFSSFYLADARAYHREGGSTGAIPGTRLLYAWQSRVGYVRKHFGLAWSMVVGVATLVFELPARLLRAGFRKSLGDARATMWATRRYAASLPSYWRGSVGHV
jgi:GT2 family glycosyltransferase